MIKRIVGVLFTIAVFGVIIVAAINFGSYRSLVFNLDNQPASKKVMVEEPKPEQTDTVKVKSNKKKSTTKKKLTPEQIEARKRARAAKAAKMKAEAEKKSSESVE